MALSPVRRPLNAILSWQARLGSNVGDVSSLKPSVNVTVTVWTMLAAEFGSFFLLQGDLC